MRMPPMPPPRVLIRVAALAFDDLMKCPVAALIVAAGHFTCRPARNSPRSTLLLFNSVGIRRNCGENQ
jgi:hypothetical protein